MADKRKSVLGNGVVGKGGETVGAIVNWLSVVVFSLVSLALMLAAGEVWGKPPTEFEDVAAIDLSHAGNVEEVTKGGAKTASLGLATGSGLAAVGAYVAYLTSQSTVLNQVAGVRASSRILQSAL